MILTRLKTSLRSRYLKILKPWRLNKALIILRPGKCNGAIVIDKSDCESKIKFILSDSTKFLALDSSASIDDTVKTISYEVVF